MTRAGRALAAIMFDAAVIVAMAFALPLPPVVAMTMLPLVFAGCVAYTLNRRQPWALPEAVEPSARTMPPGMVTMAEAAAALQGRSSVASDVVLFNRASALANRLGHAGQTTQALLVARTCRLRGMDGGDVAPHLVYRADLLALLREHGVSTSPMEPRPECCAPDCHGCRVARAVGWKPNEPMPVALAIALGKERTQR
jgi:hypothetical protein